MYFESHSLQTQDSDNYVFINYNVSDNHIKYINSNQGIHCAIYPAHRLLNQLRKDLKKNEVNYYPNLRN